MLLFFTTWNKNQHALHPASTITLRLYLNEPKLSSIKRNKLHIFTMLSIQPCRMCPLSTSPPSHGRTGNSALWLVTINNCVTFFHHVSVMCFYFICLRGLCWCLKSTKLEVFNYIFAATWAEIHCWDETTSKDERKVAFLAQPIRVAGQS